MYWIVGLITAVITLSAGVIVAVIFYKSLKKYDKHIRLTAPLPNDSDIELKYALKKFKIVNNIALESKVISFERQKPGI